MASDLTLHTYLGDVVKSEPQPDGSLMVYGVATGPKEDLDQQGCDPDWLRQAMPKFMQRGNIRYQHRPDSAIGKATRAVETDGAEWMLAAKIVDSDAIKKFQAEVLTGFSIGVKGATIKQDPRFKNGLICGGTIVEISGVDAPAYPYSFVSTSADAVGFPVMKSLGSGRYQYAGEVVTDAAPPSQPPRRAFVVRPGKTSPEEYIAMTKAVEPDLQKKDYSTDERVALAKAGKAIPVKNDAGEVVDGRYPIDNKGDLDNAIRAIGRTPAGERGEVKSHIKKQAAALDATDMLPDDWDASKAAALDVVAGLLADGNVDELATIAKALKSAEDPTPVAEVVTMASELEPEARDQRLSELAKALEPSGKPEGWDPDGDGDDDSTPEGDTDHDYWNEDGTPTAKGKKAGLKAKGDDKKSDDDSKDAKDDWDGKKPFPGAAAPFGKKGVEPDIEKVGRTISAATSAQLVSLAQTPGTPDTLRAALFSMAGVKDEEGPTFDVGSDSEDGPNTPGVEGITAVISPQAIDLLSPVNPTAEGNDGPTFGDDSSDGSSKALTLDEHIHNVAAMIAKSTLEQFVTGDLFLTKLAEAGQAKVAAVEATDVAKTTAADLTTKAQTFEERVNAQVAELRKSVETDLARIKAMPQAPQAMVTELPKGIHPVDRESGPGNAEIGTAEGEELGLLFVKAQQGDIAAQRALRNHFGGGMQSAGVTVNRGTIAQPNSQPR